MSIEKLVKQKIKKTTFDKIISSQKLKNQKSSHFDKKIRNKTEIFVLPEENYLNFKDSGKIPDFLISK